MWTSRSGPLVRWWLPYPLGAGSHLVSTTWQNLNFICGVVAMTCRHYCSGSPENTKYPEHTPPLRPQTPHSDRVRRGATPQWPPALEILTRCSPINARYRTPPQYGIDSAPTGSVLQARRGGRSTCMSWGPSRIFHDDVSGQRERSADSASSSHPFLSPHARSSRSSHSPSSPRPSIPSRPLQRAPSCSEWGLSSAVESEVLRGAARGSKHTQLAQNTRTRTTMRRSLGLVALLVARNPQQAEGHPICYPNNK